MSRSSPLPASRDRQGRRRGFVSIAVTLGSVILSRYAEACAVCFGDPNSGQTAGANNAILFLVGVTGVMLASFAAFFLYLRKRSRLAAEMAAPFGGADFGPAGPARGGLATTSE